MCSCFLFAPATLLSKNIYIKTDEKNNILSYYTNWNIDSQVQKFENNHHNCEQGWYILAAKPSNTTSFIQTSQFFFKFKF